MDEKAIKQANDMTDFTKPAEQRNDIARVLILGGLDEGAAAFSASEAMQEQLNAQDLSIGSLHQSDMSAASWLMQAGVSLISLSAMQSVENEAASIGFIGASAIGAGETEALANSPHIRCFNGVRLGFVSLAEQPAGEFHDRADLLSLNAVDRVRMLLNQCDHVIALVHSGLSEAELPLPEWRARYRRLVEAGASVVVDSGCARGWETYKNGLVFYGLGAPTGADSLALFLSLQPNGRFEHEVRALQQTAGTLGFSENAAFKAKIDAQNVMFTDEKAYLFAANEMCKRLYCERETAQKRGVMSLFSPHAEEEAKLLSLLSNESLRLVTMRAIRLMHEEERSRREIAKKT